MNEAPTGGAGVGRVEALAATMREAAAGWASELASLTPGQWRMHLGVDKLAMAALQVAALRTTLADAMQTWDRLARAYRSLDRVAEKVRPSRCMQMAPQLGQLETAIGELTAGMASMRLWTLHVAHFLESWHPFGPPSLRVPVASERWDAPAARPRVHEAVTTNGSNAASSPGLSTAPDGLGPAGR